MKRILIDAVYPEETRVVIYENHRVQEFDYETSAKRQLKGNIYLAKITRVEPSLQAAFIEYGGNKHGFLPFSEIHPDYFQIPMSDRSTVEGAEEQLVDTAEREAEGSATELSQSIKAITPPDLSDALEDEQEKRELEGLLDHSIIVEPSEEEAENAEITLAEPLVVNDQEEMLEFTDVADDEEELLQPHRSMLYRQYKIQEVIKRNQIILVQVIKEERGNKGASFTSYISLAGRYCVLMPNSARQGGISRRISNSEDRKRLKQIIENLQMPEGSSIIVRTAGAGRSKADIKRDYDYLVRLWNNIREHTLNSKAPAFIHAESDLIKRCIRDLHDPSVDEILIQGEQSYQSARQFMKMIMPNQLSKLRHYRSKTPIFARYHVDEQLSGLYSHIVHLESGGYIVINPTEALISIDVNSGKSTSERNIEETATKTNLEAAYEVARQSRLRDLSGLIVIDFIDMMEARNRRLVERTLREALQPDRAKVQIGRISPFGLLEMSRQRLRSSFLEANTVACRHCQGRGFVRAQESLAIMVLRALESEIYRGDCEAIDTYAGAELITYMMNYKRAEIKVLEDRYDVRVFFHIDMEARSDSFALEKIKSLEQTTRQTVIPTASVDLSTIEIDNYSEEEPVEEKKLSPHTNQRRKRSWKKSVATLTSTEMAEAEGTPLPIMEKEIPFEEAEGEMTKEGQLRRSRNHRRSPRKHPRRKRGGNPRFENQGERTVDTMPIEPAAPVAKPSSTKDLDSLLKGLWKRIID